jgi:excisionase family DNA binding protein
MSSFAQLDLIEPPQPARHDARAEVSVHIDVGALAERVAELVAHRLERQIVDARSPWFDVEGAADHLSCSTERLRKLVQRRQVPFHQERAGGRIFFNRNELDEWLLSQ